MAPLEVPGSKAVAPAPAPAAAPPSEVSEADTVPNSREAQRTAARDELIRAERSLDASASDCAGACRALSSMARAIAHLCALVDSPDDQRRCDGATQRLAAARERVRQSCGACPP